MWRSDGTWANGKSLLVYIYIYSDFDFCWFNSPNVASQSSRKLNHQHPHKRQRRGGSKLIFIGIKDSDLFLTCLKLTEKQHLDNNLKIEGRLGKLTHWRNSKQRQKWKTDEWILKKEVTGELLGIVLFYWKTLNIHTNFSYIINFNLFK